MRGIYSKKHNLDCPLGKFFWRKEKYLIIQTLTLRNGVIIAAFYLLLFGPNRDSSFQGKKGESLVLFVLAKIILDTNLTGFPPFSASTKIQLLFLCLC